MGIEIREKGLVECVDEAWKLRSLEAWKLR
jgi:hypothetical protein